VLVVHRNGAFVGLAHHGIHGIPPSVELPGSLGLATCLVVETSVLGAKNSHNASLKSPEISRYNYHTSISGRQEKVKCKI